MRVRSAPARLRAAVGPAQPLLGDVFGVGIGLVALVVAASLRAPPVALLAPAPSLLVVLPLVLAALVPLLVALLL